MLVLMLSILVSRRLTSDSRVVFSAVTLPSISVSFVVKAPILEVKFVLRSFTLPSISASLAVRTPTLVFTSLARLLTAFSRAVFSASMLPCKVISEAFLASCSAKSWLPFIASLESALIVPSFTLAITVPSAPVKVTLLLESLSYFTTPLVRLFILESILSILFPSAVSASFLSVISVFNLSVISFLFSVYFVISA